MIDEEHGHRRAAARGGVLTTAPWTRAPFLLLRRPSVFLAIVGAAAILAIAAASGVLFLSTLGTASLRAQAASACPEYTLPTVRAAVSGPEVATTTAVGRQAFRASGLPSPLVSDDGSAQIQDTQVHLFAKPGALAQVHRLTPDTGAPGAWFPDVFAAKIGAHVGDVVPTTTGRSIMVAGIYQDMAPNPYAVGQVPRYFCSWNRQIVATVASDQAIAATPIDAKQGPFLITDPATVAAASDPDVLVSWNAPLSHRTLSLTGFDRGQRAAAVAAARISSRTQLKADVSDQLAVTSTIAHRTRNGVAGSIVPIDVAGILVALMLVGGAGVFWATHRAREVRLLVARGAGPVQLGVKAALETLIPALLGLTGGYVTALAIVRSVGPSSVLEPGAPAQSLLLALAAIVVGLVLVGVIGGLSGRDKIISSARGRLRFVPWELGLLAIAIWLGLVIRSGSGVTVDHTIVKVSPLAFIFPIVGSTSVLLLVGRLVSWLLPMIGRLARRRGVAGYFALRRLAGSRTVVVGLILGTALPCCLFTYGSTVTDGVSHEVTAKYQTNLGAEHVLSVYGIHDRVVDPKNDGTVVKVYQAEPQLKDGTDAYVLGVDPNTFARFAFTSAHQAAQVSRLDAVPAGDKIPAILVNSSSGADASSVSILTTTLPLNIIGRDAVFPGLRNGSRPMIVVNAAALVGVDSNADRLNQWWTSDNRFDAALALIHRDGYSVLTEITSDVVIGTTGLLPVTWIFGYLRALAVLIGVVAVAGLVFALAARTRRRTVSYVMGRRMGLRPLTHLRSLLIELALVVGFGWLAGSGVGAGAFALIYRALDVYPALPPPMAFVLPAATLAVTALVTAAVVVFAAVATHTLAERANPAEILRLE
ncbi:MAG: FtsX-like permease family protein [Jatrophihabitantaceae bacterium]